MIAPKPYDRVQYTLSYLGTESITISEIKGWGDDEKEYARVDDYDGIFAKFSNNLEFVKDGKDFILFINDAYGINAEIRLKKEERHPLTDVWTESYSGYLDLSTLVELENSVTIKFNSGGVEQILKVRQNEQIEIDRENTLDGRQLPPVETINVPMDGRKIFLLSKMEDSTTNEFSTNSPYISPTLEKVISSDPMVISTYEHTDGTYFVGYNVGDDTKTFPDTQQFFYYKNDRTKYLQLTFNLDIDVQFNYTSSSLQYIKIRIQKSIFNENTNDTDPIQMYDLIYLNGNGSSLSQNLVYTNEGQPFVLELKKNECLALIWALPEEPNNIKNYFKINKNDLTITEDSFFEPTNCKMILAHELGDRITEVITNKKCFYSEALGRVGLNDYNKIGIAESTGFAHGFWIREFEKQDGTDNRFKPLTTSWADFMEAMRVTWNMGVGIDIKGKRERLRMESREFFYQPFVTIKLPNIVNNLKRSVATEFYYSGIESGFYKGGEYEESMGLDEYNGKSTFTSVIKRLKNIFKIISPFRADSYGAEFARRKTKKYYPLEDTRYDQDIFQFDLKRLFGYYIIRKWKDDFSEEPKNVYSPETAYNLRYSPTNLIFKHAKHLASSFIKYPLDYIRYASSNANSKLTTKLIGGEEVSENSDILNSKLGRAKFKPEWVEFNHECGFFIMEKVEGFTNILGKEIPNFYGLIEYRINETETERGYLFNLKPNGLGDWRILKANI